MSPVLGTVRERLAAVPPFSLGFVQLCLLQAGVDRVDPTASEVERLAALLLLAFAVSGLVLALVRPGPPQPVGNAVVGLALRGGLLLASLLTVLLVLNGARLNPLADLQFVVSLLLLSLVTMRHAYDPRSGPDAFLARWAIPAGVTALALSVPVTFAELLALA